MKKNIAILLGGYSNEFDIAVKSGNMVYQNLDRDQYHPYRIFITKDSWYYCDDTDQKFPIDKANFSLPLPTEIIHFDAVFNTIHGTPGEDGFLQAYFKLLELPQTACDFYQAALTFNKRDCISTLQPYGIPCAKNYFLNKGDTITVQTIIDTVGLPCFVKANKSGSSHGVSKANTEADILPAIAVAFEEDDEIIIESFLSGTEVSVSVIQYQGKNTVLPITEIVSENEFFDYEAKYLGKSQEITPARLTPTQQKTVEELALRVYKILKMKGLSRSEYIFHQGVPHFIEINTTPGLSEASILPQQARHAGISLQELFSSTIEACLLNPVY